MFGYDISWAAFQCIECMSFPKFAAKRIGYLAASLSFNENLDVVMLTTNLFRKDFSSQSQFEIGVALNCLANIITPDLARDLVSEIVAMMNSSRPYVRKRSTLLAYKIFLKYPEALRPTFPRLKDKLEDPEPAVVNAAVNVICEMARKSPKNYLGLAPVLFTILQTSTNNWMLIKTVKLFGALAPLEPRLGKKLVEPLTNIINTTHAKSLMYECVLTCTKGLTGHLPTMQLCAEKLRYMVEDRDPNLKYLGIVGMSNIAAVHPKMMMEHKELVLRCLEDEDVTIRVSALNLLENLATRKNLMEVVRRLQDYLLKAEGAYKDNLSEKIIMLCSSKNYHFVTDFEWYLGVLVDLVYVAGTKKGGLIATQLMDVLIRVKSVREYGVQCLMQLLADPRLKDDANSSVVEVLAAAAWIVGEFCEFVPAPEDVLHLLLHSRVASLPAHVQCANVFNAMKIFCHVGRANEEDATDPTAENQQLRESMLRLLEPFQSSTEHEVQERACMVMRLVQLSGELGPELLGEMAAIFEEELNPVAPKAQKKVPVPAGLDLDRVIHEPPVSSDDESDREVGYAGRAAVYSNDDDDDETESESESETDDSSDGSGGGHHRKHHHRKHRHGKKHGHHRKEKDRQGGSKKHAQPTGLYYLAAKEDDMASIPIQTLDISGTSPQVLIPGSGGSGFVKPPSMAGKSKGGASGKEKKKKVKKVEVLSVEEMPEGALSSDNEKANESLDLDFSRPLSDSEKLPVVVPYASAPTPPGTSSQNGALEAAAAAEKDERHSKKHHRSHHRSSHKEKEKEKEKEKKDDKHSHKSKGHKQKDKQKEKSKQGGGENLLIDFSTPPQAQGQPLPGPSQLEDIFAFTSSTPQQPAPPTSTSSVPRKERSASSHSHSHKKDKKDKDKKDSREKGPVSSSHRLSSSAIKHVVGPLCMDSTLSVAVTVALEPERSRKHLILALDCRNLCSETLTDLSVALQAHPAFANLSASPFVLPFSLGGKQELPFLLPMLCIEGIREPTALSGSLSYVAAGRGRRTLEFQLALKPSHCLLSPSGSGVMSPPNFADLSATLPGESSKKINLNGRNLQSQVTPVLLKTLQGVLIQQDAKSASFLSSTLNGESVAVHVKVRRNGELLQTDVKTMHKELSASILKALSEALKSAA
jgi:AP-3 complex subunit delta